MSENKNAQTPAKGEKQATRESKSEGRSDVGITADSLSESQSDSRHELAERARGKKQRRVFSRYEHFKLAKLGLKWRRPRGLHSKVRQGRKGKPKQVCVGFGHPTARRGLVNGYAPAIVQNVSDVRDCAKSVKAVIIGSSVGLRAMIGIANEAEKLGVKILNAEKVRAARHRVYMIEKQRVERAKAETKEKKVDAKPEMKVGTHAGGEKAEAKAEAAKPVAGPAIKPEAKK